MDTAWLISYTVLWALVLLLGFLLFGTLRTLAVQGWRLDQLEATMPSRVGRTGLKPGRKAPNFTLPTVNGREASLTDFRGRATLLVFVQPGCGPCNSVVPALNRVEASGEAQVLDHQTRSTEQAALRLLSYFIDCDQLEQLRGLVDRLQDQDFDDHTDQSDRQAGDQDARPKSNDPRQDGHARIGDIGARTLCSIEPWPRLAYLNLRNNRISSTVKNELRRHFGYRVVF